MGHTSVCESLQPSQVKPDRRASFASPESKCLSLSVGDRSSPIISFSAIFLPYASSYLERLCRSIDLGKITISSFQRSIMPNKQHWTTRKQRPELVQMENFRKEDEAQAVWYLRQYLFFVIYQCLLLSLLFGIFFYSSFHFFWCCHLLRSSRHRNIATVLKGETNKWNFAS